MQQQQQLRWRKNFGFHAALGSHSFNYFLHSYVYCSPCHLGYRDCIHLGPSHVSLLPGYAFVQRGCFPRPVIRYPQRARLLRFISWFTEHHLLRSLIGHISRHCSPRMEETFYDLENLFHSYAKTAAAFFSPSFFRLVSHILFSLTFPF